jgi:hypothetical protein
MGVTAAMSVVEGSLKPKIDEELRRRSVMTDTPMIKRSYHGALVLARFVLVTAFVARSVPAFAIAYEQPKSFSLKDNSQDKVDRRVLPKIDIEKLLAEDRVRGRSPRRPAPHRFAVPANVALSITNSGTLQTLADGRRWRLRIKSPGAKSLNLGITRFDMPDGAKLWVYDPAHTHVEGPYVARHRSHRGSLWTPVIEGDEIIVEVFAPAGVRQPVVQIAKVNRGYQSLEKAGSLGLSEGACNNDVVCPVGAPWSNQINSVGLYTINGQDACTGTLMNDTAGDGRPLFLSANHCFESFDEDSLASVIVYWNFQSPTCGTHASGPLTQKTFGANYPPLASWATSDFLLFELLEAPDPSFNVFYAGWDATGAIPTAAVAIHHPSADVKAISISNSSPDPTSDFSPSHDPNGTYWSVLWDSGVTDRGSSGSCLFDTTSKRCIGQLLGGFSMCEGKDGLSTCKGPDYYGRLSVSWNGGGTASTRLSDWLDNANTGALTNDGDAHITTANDMHYDFQGAGEDVSLRHGGLERQLRQAPIATTFNPGDGTVDDIAANVSLNTALAARVGKHRVTYEPNLSSVPDPGGLQLRVDGVLTTLSSTRLDPGDHSHIAKTSVPGGRQIDFPENYSPLATPGWWASQSEWYLNVGVVRKPVSDGGGGDGPIAASGPPAARRLMGRILRDSWLPILP